MNPKKIEALEKFMDEKFRPAVFQCLLGQMTHIQEAIDTSPENGAVMKFECRVLFSGKSPEGKLKFSVVPFVKPNRDSVEMPAEDPDQMGLPLDGGAPKEPSAAEGLEGESGSGVPAPQPEKSEKKGKKGKKPKGE